MSKTETLKITNADGVLTVSLNRPDVRNAFNEKLIQELRETFANASKDKNVRIVVLRGEGPLFSAGGDLNWMRSSLDLSAEENLKDTTVLVDMFETMNNCTKPVVGLIHGAAIGGGVGLTSVCDYVVATKETVFSLAEVRLGIVPACIGPYVVAKIGETHARAYFISAERFLAPRAKEIGLIHEVVENASELDAAGKRITSNLLQCGPNAITAAKELVRNLKTKTHKESMTYVAKMLADLRVTPEGQEGLRAFLEKRKPNWIK